TSICHSCNSDRPNSGINTSFLAFGTHRRNLRLVTLMARYVLPTSASTALTDGASDASSNVQPPTLDNPTSFERHLGSSLPELSGDPTRRSALEQQASALLPSGGSPKGSARPNDAALPAHYRGKSSGEFQRVTVGAAPDTNSLIAEAEHWLVNLAPTD